MEKEKWLIIRRALLAIVRVIEKEYGVESKVQKGKG